MKAIHIANEKRRDAEVAVDIQVRKSGVRFVLPDGTASQENVKIVKATIGMDSEKLIARFGSPEKTAEALINNDPEIDMELEGRKLKRTHKLYVDQEGHIVYRLNLFRILYNPDGTEKERLDVNRLPANINAETPLHWTGKTYPKKEALRKFVFSRKYQLRHINGVTFDFLYNMAKELDESQSVVLVGAGAKGNAPLLLTRGGQPYRGFLEGRVKEDRYALILHLSDIELKSPAQ